MDIKHTNGIPVYCLHEQMMDPDRLIPNPKNPNKHTDEQIRLLSKIIRANGWREAVTSSDLSGYIVRGHGRYEAAKLLGCQVPVNVQHYESMDDELADLIADNRIAELSTQSKEELSILFNEIDFESIGEDATGFTVDEISQIQDLISGEVESLDLDDTDNRNDGGVTVVCPKCGFEHEI
ncbi:MAG: ParB/Srx family N-terminal domain-containing protein [Clostridiales Family XIII bacterium]|uniref:ParB/Srx family N-terminal domain-containing protein n=1 Tax=Hominibacterium faecale TaxID=2839743 RepID=A0A9J6QTN8_9FIRM|nr:ParB/Srx family N-terminal domain-containing protein [Hominibacterium faecale]MCI7302316.1 ParB/Srx family N-terminal domain-containing protein [Clostridia bacterium]MCU7378139.1 ParB/Srx family N-terminal domain-containing protein [Hominibacterium faecale]MDY3011450.1 ParB/Srx family N-terminal domain-containing protein [Clostridiales Family XIII bacterium]MDY4602109.1 ParB/Srx family N-terminal domain-containing protein [Bacteroides uniformis]